MKILTQNKNEVLNIPEDRVWSIFIKEDGKLYIVILCIENECYQEIAVFDNKIDAEKYIEKFVI